MCESRKCVRELFDLWLSATLVLLCDTKLFMRVQVNSDTLVHSTQMYICVQYAIMKGFTLFVYTILWISFGFSV